MSRLAVLLAPLFAAGLCAYAADCATPEAAVSPEQVVRRYTKAAVAHGLEGFVALHARDMKKFVHDEETAAFRLTTSGQKQLRAKCRANFARTPPVQVEILDMLTMGKFVVRRDRATGLPDGQVADELTIYQVRDGQVRSIWYLEQTKTK